MYKTRDIYRGRWSWIRTNLAQPDVSGLLSCGLFWGMFALIVEDTRNAKNKKSEKFYLGIRNLKILFSETRLKDLFVESGISSKEIPEIERGARKLIFTVTRIFGEM